MRILSLPKYNMSWEEWFLVIMTIVLLFGAAAAIRDCKNMEDKWKAAEEQCASICYPNPVASHHLTVPNNECICNTQIEYRK
jgi:hypothetical protein